MACSPAQLEANRRNAREWATGPRTEEGKARSRRNSLKTGLTGAGIVLPDEDAEEVERRFETFEAEMRPRSEMARQLVSRVALMTIRLDRSAEHEAKAIGHRMRRAAAEFDAVRLAEVDRLIAWIASEPTTNARRLRTMPEGIDRLIAAIEGLRADLTRQGGYRWGFEQCDRLLNLMGCRFTDLPVHRVRALTDAIAGQFRDLDETEGAGLEIQDRRLWAIGQMVDLIDRETEALKAIREGLDLEGLELDRAEAASRAIFDPSKEAILARKYEAASERGLYRALREFRDLQAEVIVDKGVGTAPVGELGSFSPASPGGDDEESGVDSIDPEPLSPVVDVVENDPKSVPNEASSRANRRKRPVPGGSRGR